MKNEKIGRLKWLDSLSIGNAAAIGVFLFIFCNIFDMNGEHYYKYLGFAAVCPLLCISLLVLKWDVQMLVLSLVMFFCWPVVSLCIGLANGADLKESIMQTTPFSGYFIGLMLAPMVGGLCVARYLYNLSLVAAALVVIGTVCGYFQIGDTMIHALPGYISCHIDPYAGTLGHGELRERIYLTATLWFVPASVYFAFRNQYLRSIVCIIGLLFAVSKSGTAIAICGVLLSLWKRAKEKNSNGQKAKSPFKRLRTIVLLIVGLRLGFVVFPDFRFDVYRAIFGGDTVSLDVRIGHIRSFIEQVKSDPQILLYGQGSGARFYSYGTGNMEVRMETDHIDLIRQHGLPWSLAFFALCIVLATRLTRSSNVDIRASGWALAVMFVAAGTNPHLKSPLFLFLLASCYILWKDEVHVAFKTKGALSGIEDKLAEAQ